MKRNEIGILLAIIVTFASGLSVARAELWTGFVENRGQKAEPVKYYAETRHGTLFCCEDGLVFVTKAAGAAGSQKAIYRLKFLDVSESRVVATSPRETRMNYFIGNDPSRWVTNAPTFNEVVYTLGSEERLRLHFETQALKWRAMSGTSDNPSGPKCLLVINHDGGRTVRFADAWGRLPSTLSSSRPQDKRAADPDWYPRLEHSTFLGGTGDDRGCSVGVAANGAVYVAGRTESSDFPSTSGWPGGSADYFVVRFNPTLNRMLFGTYIGGSGNEVLWSMNVDSAGNAYGGGLTSSANMPDVNAIQDYLAGGPDAYAFKLSPDGDELLIATYYGGDEYDTFYIVEGGGDGSLYAAGTTGSSGLALVNPVQEAVPPFSFHGMALRIQPGGNEAIYATYLHGTPDGGETPRDSTRGGAVCPDGSFVVCGETRGGFPQVNPIVDYRSESFVVKIAGEGKSRSRAGTLVEHDEAQLVCIFACLNEN